MGRIYEQFHSLKYENEEDVNQKFVIPLLTNCLGYSLDDIIPQKNYPVPNAPKTTRRFPDYVVCIDDKPKFIVESKAPKENLENHLEQIWEYAHCVRVNLLVLTNGTKLRIYDVYNLLLKTEDTKELQEKFYEVEELLSKENRAFYSLPETMKSIDFGKALGKSPEQILEEEKRERQLKIFDFQEYLKYVENEFQNWQIPQELPNLEIEQYPPDRLHRFRTYESSKSDRGDQRTYVLSEIDRKFDAPIKIFIGSSGIGKTTLLKYIAYTKARECLSLKNVEIPVFISLRNYGSNLGLKDLIIRSLERGGMNTSLEDLSEFLQKQTFFFLLDAFDEVRETYLEDVRGEIEELSGIGNHKTIITSRESRQNKINLSHSSRFFVSELEEDEIENLLERCLGSERFDFLFEIERKRLTKESKNTLLLLLMILIYKEYQDLPPSKTKIIGKIVEKIKEWEKSKSKRLISGLRWEAKEKILSELAYKAVETPENLVLSREEVDDVLIPLLMSLENKREIPRGIDKYQVLEDLALTGIVNYSEDVLSFWHRVFLEYFASKALADKYLENPKVLEDIKDKLSWIPIIIGSTKHLDDATNFIEIIKGVHLIVASACIIEAKKVNEDVIKDVVSLLAESCSSSIGEIRSRAISYLRRIDLKYTMDIFFNLLENNEYPQIRKIALEEIAREKSNRAKKAVYKLIDWNDTSIFFGSTRGSVAKALSHFGEKDHFKIIEIWREAQSIFTSGDCREAMLNIVREGRLTEDVKEALLNFYLEEVRSDAPGSHRRWDLADVLISIGDENFVPRLIDSFDTEDRWSSQNIYTEDILASYKSGRVIEHLSSKTTDQSISDPVREGCSAALSKSKGKVPLSVFEKLLEDKNPEVRENAVKGMDRFPAAEIKDLLLGHIDEERAGIQREVMKVLGEKGLLVELVEKNMFPKKLYVPSIEIVLGQIRKYRLRAMISILDSLRNNIHDNNRLLIDVAHTYCAIEEKKKGKEIIESFFQEGELTLNEFDLEHLAEMTPILDSLYALRIIRKILKSIDKFEDEHKLRKEECVKKCVSSLERIDHMEIPDILKNLAKKYAPLDNMLITARVLEAVNRLATNEDEKWYIEFIKSNPNLKGVDLRRVIEGLGKTGSKMSIPIIREIAASHRDDEYLIDTCFLSIENIYAVKDKLIEITEKDLLKKAT